MRHGSSAAPAADSKKPLTWAGVWRLLRLALPYKWLLAAAGFLGLISSAANFAPPLLAKGVLNDVLQSKSVAKLDMLGLWMVLAIVGGAVFGFTQYLLTAYAGQRIVLDLRLRLIAHLQRLPIPYFDKTRSGDLTSLLSNDVSQVQQVLTSDISSFFSNIITLGAGITLALVLDWKLTLVVVVLLLCVMSIFIIFGWRLRKAMRESLDALSDAMGATTEAFANIRLVKAFAREGHEDARAEEKLGKVFRLGFRSSQYEGGMHTAGFVGFILVLLGVMWFGGRKVLAGDLSAGELLAFFMTVTIISGPMASLSTLYARLQRASGAADRVFEALDQSREQPDAPDAVAFPNGEGRVELKDVAFHYSEESPVLKGLSLDLPPGKVTALVGASGSGKTTVSALLYRFYEPQSGDILVDGVSILKIRREALRQNVGIVPQDPMLFNGTLRENIAYGKLDATDEEIKEAARAANVMEFVDTMPDGFETLVGERGVTLSGGQRQRVAIARAVLKNPRILILDEATSSLDTRSESLVQQALNRLMVGRTTLVIAHRLTTIQSADQIAVLDAGKIVEIGRHDALLSSDGRYAELQRFAVASGDDRIVDLDLVSEQGQAVAQSN